jgi:tetratricopeptide (TPR) repeat protein
VGDTDSREAVDLFVGRDRELDALSAALKQAHEGRGGVLMVGGEPGVGKTTLVERVARAAADAGSLVAWGRCWEGGGAPAYWPWVQAIRSLARDIEGDLAGRLGPGAAHVAKIVPELAERLPDMEPAPELEPERARFALFDAVAGFLQSASQDRPLLIALDDLHAADLPSLLLLRYAARELRGCRVLVVGTYREVEARMDPSVGELIGEIGRDGRRLPLRGLSENQVERFISETAGSAPSREVLRAVHEATEGNPFFVDEVVRLLTAEGQLEAGSLPAGLLIPDEVRDAVRRRLEPLPDPAREVLSVAAVLGREFGVPALELMTGIGREELVEILEDAGERAIVGGLPGAIGRYLFAHALFRETLYADLAPTRRAQLHRKAGEAIESLYADELEPWLDALAHHFFQAASSGDLGKAIDYSVAAAEGATSMLAYEDAALHYGRALQAFGLEERADVPRRCDLLLALGEAQSRAGDTDHARETLQRAYGLARKLESPDRLARAALAYGAGVGGFEFGRVDETLVRLLREARAALEGEDSALLARVSARLAVELYFSASAEEREDLSGEAVAIAQRVGDPAALASALSARHLALWGPENLDERLEAATEVIRLGESEDDRELTLRGRVWRMADLMERGDVTGADAELDHLMSGAEELRDPLYLWNVPLLRAMRATLEGRFADGEQLAADALAIGQGAQAQNAVWLFSIQQLALRRDQGRLEEIEPALAGFIERYPATPHWRTGMAYVYAELGRLPDAAVELEAAAAGDFGAFPRDGEWLSAMGMLSEAAAAVGDADRAARLLELIEPFSDRNVMAGRGAASFGPAARYCGLLAAAIGRHDEAERHFAAAEELAARMRALPALARVRCDRAAALIAHGDQEAAAPMLASAAKLARDLGMTAVERRATELSGGAPAATPESAPAAAAPSGAVFTREGEFWTISYRGEPFRLKDSKGLRYIARLLGTPGQEHHAVDLVSGASASGGGATAAQAREAGLESDGLGDAGALLDPQAKAQYASRLEELREEAEEAEQFNDPERAARAREEIEFIGRELAGAVGLGGRDRKAASASERARVNVTRTIRAALDRIGDNDAALGRYLGNAIKTGTFCSYEPDPGAPVEWQLSE